MATKLTKPVVRECVTSRWKDRPLMSSMEPATDRQPERIVIREKGRRMTFALPILTIYRLAAEQFAADEKRSRAAERRARHAARR